MRFRRKGRKRPRANGMKGDWIFLMNNLCSDIIPNTDPCSALVVANTDQRFLIDSTDIDDKQDALTICRIVGEFCPLVNVVWDDSATGTVPRGFRASWHMGIYTSSVNHTSGDISQLDPANQVDLDSDRWLFLRTWLVTDLGPVGETSGGVGATPMRTFWWTPQDYAENMNTHLDIRVKRRLVEGDSLVMVNRLVSEPRHGTDIVPDHFEASYRASLRGYVKF